MDKRLIMLGIGIAAVCALIYLRTMQPDGGNQPHILTVLASLATLSVGLGLGWLNAGRGRISTAMLITGGAITVTGDIMLVTIFGLSQPLFIALAILILVAVSLALILTPLWVTLRNQLLQAKTDEVRERTRADMAAHLHDSVLQTLALIQQSQDDPERVRALARSEEKQLRHWLYGERAEGDQAAATSLEDLLTQLVTELETTHGAGIEMVCTGDKANPPSGATLLAVTREALTNALKHGSPPVDLYVEQGPEIEVFVRDRGPGFDLGDLPQVQADRHGVRDSILQRTADAGGSVRYRKLQSGGTEFYLRLPRQAPEVNPPE